MLADKFRFPDFPQQAFRSEPEVFVFRDKQAQLIGKIEVGLVVGRGRKQDALAFIFLDVFLDGPIAFSLAVTQVVAFVNEYQAIPAKLGSSLIAWVMESTLARSRYWSR